VREIQAAGDQVVSSSEDGTVRLWNARSGDSLAVLTPQQRSAAHLDADSTTWGSASGKWPYETRERSLVGRCSIRV
jgi:WD40 repeat protein